MSRLICLQIFTFALIASSGCATIPRNNSAQSTSNATSSAPSSDLEFYRSLNLATYIAPYTHDDIKVPDAAPAVLSVAGFSTNQPVGESRTLAQIAVRVREATPGERAALKANGKNGKGNAFTSAVITVKSAPGFTLSKLHGAEKFEVITDGVSIILDSLQYGEWRIFIAELEGIHAPGTERLIGATLRCTRLSDGFVFESLGGEKIDWQRPEVPVKVNKWVARNALIFSNGEALKEVSRLSEKNENARALSLIGLQLNSIRILRDFDSTGLEQETQRFLAVREQVAKKLAMQNPNAQIQPVPTTSTFPDAATRTAHAAKGVELAKQAPIGLWGALAKLLVLVKG